MTYLLRIKNFLQNQLWTQDPGPTGSFRAMGIRMIRFFHLVGLAFINRELSLQASSLVYTTLLSLLPLLAVSFSMLKAFGAHNMLEGFLIGFLAPLGPEGKDLAMQTTEYVDRLNAGVLGSIGLVFLLYKAISLMYELEITLNSIWAAENTKSHGQRLGNYLSVLLVGPVLVLTATGITVSFMSTSFIVWVQQFEPVGTTIFIIGELLHNCFQIYRLSKLKIPGNQKHDQQGDFFIFMVGHIYALLIRRRAGILVME